MQTLLGQPVTSLFVEKYINLMAIGASLFSTMKTANAIYLPGNSNMEKHLMVENCFISFVLVKQNYCTQHFQGHH